MAQPEQKPMDSPMSVGSASEPAAALAIALAEQTLAKAHARSRQSTEFDVTAKRSEAVSRPSPGARTAR